MLQEKGPLLIAANHPNSFLDAIIVGSLFKSPVYSLARGDAFAGKFISKILRAFNMLPVYRVSEGVENLGHNYTTFDACEKLFAANNIVLIFSEGSCVNEWHLRPLKKGTARLAWNALEKKQSLKVLPLGINYSSFRSFGKNVFLNFGNIISIHDFPNDIPFGRYLKEFNEKLSGELENLVFEIDKNDRKKAAGYFQINQSLIKRILLFIPAIIGLVTAFPLYFIFHLIIKKRAQDHYDSVMTGLLFFFYPLYILVIMLAVYFITMNVYSFLLVLILPFGAWSYLQMKTQVR
jgi:1-acyl-sn-glycerol-3-phosphate acyltransferase